MRLFFVLDGGKIQPYQNRQKKAKIEKQKLHEYPKGLLLQRGVGSISQVIM